MSFSDGGYGISDVRKAVIRDAEAVCNAFIGGADMNDVPGAAGMRLPARPRCHHRGVAASVPLPPHVDAGSAMNEIERGRQALGHRELKRPRTAALQTDTRVHADQALVLVLQAARPHELRRIL